MTVGQLTFKIADSPAEFEAIHRLNHRTFAEEIPQHPRGTAQRLVDRFHGENTYVVCLDGDRLVGMVAGRTARPFSLDGKLDGLDGHLPAGRRPVEVRLLAVDPAYRRTAVTSRLVALVAGHFAALGCDLAIISGTTRALALYRRLGFVPFGPLVGAPGAYFQPMYLTIEDAHRVRATALPRPGSADPAGPAPAGRAGSPPAPASFLPGPVTVAPAVAAALARPAVYHRGAAFGADLVALRARLARLVHARDVHLLLGSGTLANDVVAGQLRLLGTPGLVLANGEFGERLVDHARRAGLSFEAWTVPWGRPFPPAELAARVDRLPPGGWLWAVHCETSTGTLIDLDALGRRCAARGVLLCADCISSIGAVPLDLSGVHLATGASGKALGAYPGLSMVFHNTAVRPAPAGPRYLDLGAYAAADGVPYTHSSNLLAALAAALDGVDWPARYAEVATAARWLRAGLRRRGLTLVGPDDSGPGGSGPGGSGPVLTVALPPDRAAAVVGARMAAEGYLLAYQSGYLCRRNWIQIALMGRWTWPTLRALSRDLAAAVRSG